MIYNQHYPYFSNWPRAAPPPQPGDEIAALGESGQLVGKTIFNGGFSAMTIYGDDYYTPNVVENLADGESFTIEIWSANKNSTKQYKFNKWLRGNDIFEAKKISVVGTDNPEDKAQTLEVKVIPNPGSGQFYLALNSSEMTGAKIRVFDISGRIVHEKNIKVIEGIQKHKLDLTKLSEGTYTVLIKTPQFIKSINVVISR